MQKVLTKKEIGKKIQELRHQNHLSQPEAANIFNVSLSTYVKWENGLRIIRDEHKVAIANFYNQTVQEVFYE